MDAHQIPSKYVTTKYMPSTFEERGAAAPFTTPDLACARVRLDDRHNLVLLTPGFAGTAAVFVLPWKAIPEMFKMTMHDRALFDVIEEARATTPSAMRRESLRVMASGLAGPEAQSLGRKAIAADQSYHNEIQAILLVSLLQALDIDASKLVDLDFARSNILFQAKQALSQAITPLGIEPDVLYERMTMLAAALSFVGLGSYGTPGRLRVLLDQLKAFHKDMGQRSARSNTDAAAFYGYASETAAHTIGLATSVLQSLDQCLQNLPDVVRHWQRNFPNVTHLTGRLSWLLDGWDYVMGFAKNIDDWSGEDLWANLETLARMLPLVPRDETDQSGSANLMRFAEMVQRRRVRANQDWRTGELDRDLISRLEAAKH